MHRQPGAHYGAGRGSKHVVTFGQRQAGRLQIARLADPPSGADDDAGRIFVRRAYTDRATGGKERANIIKELWRALDQEHAAYHQKALDASHSNAPFAFPRELLIAAPPITQ